MQSFAISRIGLSRADPQPVIDALRTENEAAARRALILALHSFGKDCFDRGQREELIDEILVMYRDEPDPGVHGAAGWLLRQWGKTKDAVSIDESFSKGSIAQGNRRWNVSKSGLKMMKVPGDSYQMGGSDSDVTIHQVEKPRHTVQVSSFWMSQYEVPQGLYKAVMGNNPSSITGSPLLPVNDITWFDAVDFCNKLSDSEGLEPFYRITNDVWNDDGRLKSAEVECANNKAYRLPTEAEWEYACRAGTTSKWSCGNDESLLYNYAWCGSTSGKELQAVGIKMPNPWGLHDMEGSLGEWCWDWYGEYSPDPATDPYGPENGTERILRSGSFKDPPEGVRCSARYLGPPTFVGDFIGFHVCRNDL